MDFDGYSYVRNREKGNTLYLICKTKRHGRCPGRGIFRNGKFKLTNNHICGEPDSLAEAKRAFRRALRTFSCSLFDSKFIYDQIAKNHKVAAKELTYDKTKRSIDRYKTLNDYEIMQPIHINKLDEFSPNVSENEEESGEHSDDQDENSKHSDNHDENTEYKNNRTRNKRNVNYQRAKNLKIKMFKLKAVPISKCSRSLLKRVKLDSEEHNDPKKKSKLYVSISHTE